MSSTPAPVTHPPWDRLQRGALVVGAAGLFGCVLGAMASPPHFFRSYLVALNYWLGVSLGCLFILMVQYLTGGGWGLLLRRVLEAGARTLTPLALFFIPLIFGLRSLYQWAEPEMVAHDEELQHKSAYLDVPFFSARAVIYFAIWLTIAWLFSRWSKQQDQAPQSDEGARFRLLSGPGLVLYGLTITFASIDWVMSLEPHWYSTIYPAMFASGQALEGMAFAVIVIVLLADHSPLSEIIRPIHYRDFGNLLLMFTMIWAYLSFSQFLLIWAENMPEETPWYLRRLRDGWQWVALLLVLFQFACPFLFLLFRDVKEKPRRLLVIAAIILLMRFLDVFWWIEAAFTGGMSFYWLLDLAALAGLGGLWVWWFLWQLGQRPLLPLHDPYMQEAIEHD